MSLNEQDEVFFFSKLPMEMWNEIFKYLNPLDVFCNAINVCKNWRFYLLKFYLSNYLLNNLNFLNFQSIDTFINELFNDEELFTKFKKYLLKQHVKNLATQLQQKQFIDTDNKNYLFKNNFERELIDLFNYFYSINFNKYIVLDNDRDTNNTATSTSCFGTSKPTNNKSNYNDLNVNNTNKTIIYAKHNNYISNRNTDNLTNFKSVLIGESRVGKSSFLLSTIHKKFNEFSESTIGASFLVKQHVFEDINLTFKLEIWDTAGPERYRALSPIYYRAANILFICFDLTDRDSFDYVRKCKEEIENYSDGMFKEFIMLGCKNDLKRVVTREEAEKLAFEMEVIYFEVSSKLMENIDAPTWYAVLTKYCVDKFIKRMTK